MRDTATMPPEPSGTSDNRNVILALALIGVVAGMVGLAFAAVPLYAMFCKATGYAGTPGEAAGARTLPTPVARTMTVRFDANVARELPWQFKPEQPKVTVHVGEEMLAKFSAKNLTSQPIVGRAVFNVTPFKAAQYFTKIECFCFTEQRLEPGQEVSMPVTFYIDPAIVNDANARDVDTVTLSYTFFRDDTAERHSAAPAPTPGTTGRGS